MFIKIQISLYKISFSELTLKTSYIYYIYHIIKSSNTTVLLILAGIHSSQRKWCCRKWLKVISGTTNPPLRVSPIMGIFRKLFIKHLLIEVHWGWGTIWAAAGVVIFIYTFFHILLGFIFFVICKAPVFFLKYYTQYSTQFFGKI